MICLLLFRTFYRKINFFKECGEKFNNTHSYMTQSGSGKTSEVFEQFCEYLDSKAELIDHYLIDPSRFSNWHLEVVRWYNNWVANGWHFKPQQLYLYGRSNQNKSRLITYLFSKFNFNLNPN